jgi:hypothetical protein
LRPSASCHCSLARLDPSLLNILASLIKTGCLSSNNIGGRLNGERKRVLLAVVLVPRSNKKPPKSRRPLFGIIGLAMSSGVTRNNNKSAREETTPLLVAATKKKESNSSTFHHHQRKSSSRCCAIRAILAKMVPQKLRRLCFLGPIVVQFSNTMSCPRRVVRVFYTFTTTTTADGTATTAKTKDTLRPWLVSNWTRVPYTRPGRHRCDKME